MITPYPGSGIPKEQDNFNFYSSVAATYHHRCVSTLPRPTACVGETAYVPRACMCRMSIDPMCCIAECAFGMLVRR